MLFTDVELEAMALMKEQPNLARLAGQLIAARDVLRELREEIKPLAAQIICPKDNVLTAQLDAIARVLPAWKTKPRRLTEPTMVFDEKVSCAAYDAWGCNCGPAALAMMLSLQPDDVRPHLQGFDEKRYTNPTMMAQALKSLGVGMRKATGELPEYGLCRVQWEGPWTAEGVPMRARYRYTHWVGVMSGDIAFVFDVNSGWSTFNCWKVNTVPLLTALYPRASGGWHFTHRWELEIA